MYLWTSNPYEGSNYTILYNPPVEDLTYPSIKKKY